MGKVELKIEIDAELLEQARSAGVGVEAAVDSALRAAVSRATAGGADERAKCWAEDNAEAIAAYNRRIASRGLFGDDYRKW